MNTHSISTHVNEPQSTVISAYLCHEENCTHLMALWALHCLSLQGWVCNNVVRNLFEFICFAFYKFVFKYHSCVARLSGVAPSANEFELALHATFARDKHVTAALAKVNRLGRRRHDSGDQKFDQRYKKKWK